MSDKKDDSDVLRIRRRPDGSLYKTRKEMIEQYKNSFLPWPFSVYKLDFCSNLLKSHLKYGAIFSFPFSLLVSYILNPNARDGGFSSKPKVYYLANYFAVYFAFVFIFSLDSIIFSDYCKAWSKVYSQTKDDDEYIKFIKNRIKTQQLSGDIQDIKSINNGLKDNEI